jgi:hypothetical protein
MKKVLILFLAAALLLPLAACGVTEDKPTNDLEDTMRTLIVKNEKIASATVQTGESASEKYAGKELAAYLARLGIPAGDGLTIDVRIDPELPVEGYAIHPEKHEVTIRGGDERGVIYGVYGFLTHYAGVRFFMPGLETLGAGDIIVNDDYALTPAFEHRRCDWEMFRYDPDWCVKNGVNNLSYGSIPKSMGGTFDYADDLFAGTMARLTGTDQLSEQPCLSDPEVLKQVIAGVRAALAKDPGARIVSVSQNDNENYCKCEKCAAVEREEGSPAGSLIRFVNAVADDIAADYPNVVVDTFAYTYSRKPPKKTKPRDNVSVMICSYECCFAHPLSDMSCPKNVDFCRDLVAWSKICRKIRVWDYVANYGYFIPTYANFRVMQENMRFFAEHNVIGVYPEGAYNTPASGEFGELRSYLLAKLLADPAMGLGEYYRHMDEFLAAFYGAGWRYIRAYIDWFIGEAGRHHADLAAKPLSFITEDRYAAMEETFVSWWDKAEEMAQDEAVRERVRRSRLQLRCIQLMLHPDAERAAEFVEDMKRWGVRWREKHPLPEKQHLALSPEKWSW